MKNSPWTVPSILILAVGVGGCGKAADPGDNSSSAKASSEAMTHGTSDGTGKVVPPPTGAAAAAPNPLAGPPKVAGEAGAPGTAPAAPSPSPTPAK